MPTKLSRYAQGIMEAAWLAALVITPVFFDIYSSRIFEPDKITFLRSIALVILAAWVVKLIDEHGFHWVNFQPGESAWKTFLRIPLVIPVIGLMVVYILSTLFSVSPSTSLWGSYQRQQGTYTYFSYLVIFAAMAFNLRRRAQVERIVTVIIIAALPVSLYTLLQRNHIDPIGWAGDVSQRVAANLGNPIFLAAYLLMVFPLTLMRIVQTFDAILHDEDKGQTAANVVRGVFYVFTGIMAVIAQYMSGSRGPLLGLATGTFLMLLLLTWQWGKRWLTVSMMALAAAVLGFLLLLNVPNGPLEGLRKSPVIGRYGQLFNEQSNNSLVRKYIWQGAADLVSPHAPIQFPDGSQDGLNSIRPLIGYGPESMYVAYNPFYVPALGHVEKRNASPDRSHNETWDSLVTTGALGMVVYLLVFGSVTYYALKWLGFFERAWQRKLFLGLTLAGGLAGSLGAILWRRREYFGLGLPFGLLAGVGIYVAMIAVAFPRRPFATRLEAMRSLLITALLAAVIAHFVEIHFGIVVAVTRTYFWTYSALILLAGYILPKSGQYDAPAHPVTAPAPAQAPESRPEFAGTAPGEPSEKPAPAASRSSTGGRAKAGRRSTQASGRAASRRSEGPGWRIHALAAGLLVGLLLVLLAFNYIQNNDRLISVGQILANSFTKLPNRGYQGSLGIIVILGTTWLAGCGLLTSENIRLLPGLPFLKSLAVAAGASLAVFLVFSGWQAGSLARLASVTPANINDMLRQVDSISGFLTQLYFFVFILVLALGALLREDAPARLNPVSPMAGVAAPFLAILAIFLISVTNLRIIHADITFKTSDSFQRPQQWAVATEMLKHANALAPDEDYYYLFLGRSYLEAAKETTDVNAQGGFVLAATADLKVAQKINPLNTDHTANLGRLSSWWAVRAPDGPTRQQYAQMASDYYARAVTLSPNNSTLWGEWAIVYLDVLNQPDKAYANLQHALELDSEFNFTHGLLADYFKTLGDRAADAQQKSQLYQQALDQYGLAIQYSGSDKATKISYLIYRGNLNSQLAQVQPALNDYLQAIDLKPASTDLWKIQEMVARLYLIQRDKPNALKYAQAALASAPADKRDSLNQLLVQINALP